ncbi:MAG: twin-arginine translocation signal domain-containing protein [Planctomycetia bacterium]|nr:twin-arginine translocation signal domain-containing protein [Planctomycetia bacterium]
MSRSRKPRGSSSAGNPSRREFLQTAAAAALAAAAAPAVGPVILGAEDKAGGKNVVIGEGEFKYECLHDWGLANLPKGAHYGNASHGVTIDAAGLIYITHYGAPGSIFVFDPDGTFVKSLGDFHMAGGHGCGHGIDIRKEGNQEFLYLSASESSLDFAKIDLKGELVWRRGREQLHKDSGKYPEGAAYRPTNVSFSPDGGYFLGDGYGSNLIHQYDKKDNYVRTIGGTGEGSGQFKTPHGQWLDDRDGKPKLVVADRANKRLQWFDMDGKHVKTLDGFLFPADIDIRGELMLVPDLHCRVTILDKNDKVIAQLGDDEAWRKTALEGFRMRGQRDQWQPGKFVHPHDARWDKDGNIFVAEWVATGRVTKLRHVS